MYSSEQFLPGGVYPPGSGPGWTNFLSMDVQPRPDDSNITYVETPGGSRLATQSFGPPDGDPVIVEHGSPGSGRGPIPQGSALRTCNLRVITYDRLGYGLSSEPPSPDTPALVADSAKHVLAIANHYGLGQFGVVGRSRGAVNALACAHDEELRGRVQRVGAMVGLAPPAERIGSQDKPWHEGMAKSNVDIYKAARPARVEQIGRIVAAMQKHPAFLYSEWWHQLKPADVGVIGNITFTRQVLESYAEAVRQGPQGWIHDLDTLHNPKGWGFQLEDIHDTQVLLWQAVDDQFAPRYHYDRLLHVIPGVQLVEAHNAAHFTAFSAFLHVASWTVGHSVDYSPQPYEIVRKAHGITHIGNTLLEEDLLRI